MYWFVQYNSQVLGSRTLWRQNKIIFACSGDMTIVSLCKNGQAPRQKTRRKGGRDQDRGKMQEEDEERLAFR